MRRVSEKSRQFVEIKRVRHLSLRGTTIAGKLPNTPPDLVRWIMHPQAIEPGTDMPDLGVPLRGARDIAAYLLTLGSPRFPYHLAG